MKRSVPWWALPYWSSCSSAVVSGKFLQATVGPGLFVTLRLNGSVVKTLPAGSYTISLFTFIDPIEMIQPRIEISEDTTVVMDGRLSLPADVSAPDQPLDLLAMQTVYFDVARDIS